MDALDGHILWHYWWKSRGGIHIGNRGMAMYGDWLFFETPDDYLVSLDAKTGQERWHREIADFNQQYFSTTAPLVVGDHVLVGDRQSTRLNSSHSQISYAVFCLKKKITTRRH